MKGDCHGRQREEGLCNKGGDKCYCGPFYFPKKWKCYLSEWFNKSCRRHDHDYRMNNGRLASDWRFFMGMIKQSKGSPLKWLVAFVFYISVFIFGWYSYYFGGEKGPEKD